MKILNFQAPLKIDPLLQRFYGKWLFWGSKVQVFEGQLSGRVPPPLAFGAPGLRVRTPFGKKLQETSPKSGDALNQRASSTKKGNLWLDPSNLRLKFVLSCSGSGWSSQAWLLQTWPLQFLRGSALLHASAPFCALLRTCVCALLLGCTQRGSYSAKGRVSAFQAPSKRLL